MFFKIVVSLCLAVLLSPVGFWFFYGTIEPCKALAYRAVDLYVEENPPALDKRIVQGLAPGLFLQRINAAGLTDQQCLRVLVKIETGDRSSI